MKIDFQKLQIAMASACMNKSELAAASGLSRVSITKYFSGGRQPSIKAIGKIAKALDVPVTDIIEDGGHGPKG